MTHSLALWLAFVIAVGAIAYFGSRRQAVAFALAAALTLPAAFLPLSYATPLAPPPGKHTVLGARIDVDVAIYVLLDGPTEPRLHRLPYSAEAANQLQAAQDGMADGEGGVALRVGQDGSPGFSEDSGTPEPPKQAERALIQ
ncbi:p042 [Rhizobium phage 16-3]|uniref:p042 n=1 Tax=Rhizobium phage 16-3 TaxID=10704 RepID=UPI00017BA5CE|nr:p042 [Rhizobium phage 16-3]ABF71294.1 p042 [Rhizobium phage 16-3]